MSEAQDTIAALMSRTAALFYAGDKRAWFRDQRLLKAALTWPSTWMLEHGHRPPMDDYRETIEELLKDIQQNGAWQQARAQGYFTRYLAKSLQDYFQHHADAILARYKSLGFNVDAIVAKALSHSSAQPDHSIDILAEAHKIASMPRAKKSSAPAAAAAPAKKRVGRPRKGTGNSDADPLQTSLF